MPCPATLKACPSIRDPESTNPARRVFPCRAVLRSHRPQNPYRIGQPHYVPVMWAGRGCHTPAWGGQRSACAALPTPASAAAQCCTQAECTANPTPPKTATR